MNHCCAPARLEGGRPGWRDDCVVTAKPRATCGSLGKVVRSLTTKLEPMALNENSWMAKNRQPSLQLLHLKDSGGTRASATDENSDRAT